MNTGGPLSVIANHLHLVLTTFCLSSREDPALLLRILGSLSERGLWPIWVRRRRASELMWERPELEWDQVKAEGEKEVSDSRRRP